MSKKNNFRRYNPLMDEWIIVAANRISRPWQGAKTTKCTSENVENKEANCLSPMSVRSSGIINENYKSTWVFQNDFPSFTEFEKCAEKNENDDLFKEEEICGTCRVICYHPNSQITLATMSYKEIRQVINVWNDQYLELCPKYEWVQIFENRGSIVGCSNMHPHGQLWASNYLPTIPQKKFDSQLKYFKNKGKVMLVDYLEKEIIKNQRIVIRNSYWTILVPFWAFWPYETMILPNRHVINFTDLSTNELDSLAEILQLLLIKYDNIFECSFPYMMGWSSAPSGATYSTQNLDHWQLHCSFFPPLLRSATVPKYLAGYEVFAEKQRDLTPEMAAKNLQNTSNVHYSARNSTTTTTKISS